MNRKNAVLFPVAVLMLLAASGEARADCPSPGTFASLTLTSGDVNCGPYTLTGTASIASGAGVSPATANTDAIIIPNAGTSITITNNGTIAGNGTGSGIKVGETSAASATLSILTNTGTIETGSGKALWLQGSSIITNLTNTGTINGGTGNALVLDGSSSIPFVPGPLGESGTGGITGTFTSSGTAAATVVLNSTGTAALFRTNSNIINTNSAPNRVALSITATPTGTITNQGTITAAAGGIAVSIAAEDTIFANEGTINGRIIDSGNEDITLNNSGTITGAVALEGDGTHTLTLSSGTITGAYTGGEGVDTLNLNGGAIIGSINLGLGANTINVNGAFTSAGTITATNGFDEGAINLDVNAVGTFTVNNSVNLGTGNITVSEGGTLNIGSIGNLTTTGTLYNSGTIMIAEGRTLTAAKQQGNFGLLSIGVSPAVGANPASAGKLVLTGTPNISGGYETDGGVNLDNASITIKVATTNGFIPVGTQFTIIDANGSVSGNLPDVISTSILYRFSLSKVSNNDVLLTVASSANSIATNKNNSSVANTFIALGANTAPELTQIQTSLINAPTITAANKILESTLPTMDGGVSQSAFNVNNQVQGITTGRLEHIREGFNNRSGSIIRQNSFASSLSQSVRSDDSVGFSNASYNTVAANSDIRAMLGNNETRVSVSDNVWLQGFGQKATQNTRDFIQGYDATTYGIIMGADTHEIFDSGTVGIAFNYGKAKIDSKNAADARNNVDSYGVIVYGTHPVTETIFFDGQLGYNFNQIDSTRNNVGGTGLTAKANYGANQYSARGLVGKDYQVGSGFMVTPTVSLTYTRLAVQGFTETGANGLNLKVNSSEYNILDLGLGVRAERVFTTASGMQIRPSAHAGYRYDMIGDKIQTTSTFTGGGPAFTTTGGEAQKSKFNIGGGIGVGTLHDWQLSAEYDYEIQTDYSAHSGFLRASSPF
ncbi:MAG: autotransporter domain-containing protein [Holosporales bacterium]